MHSLAASGISGEHIISCLRRRVFAAPHDIWHLQFSISWSNTVKGYGRFTGGLPDSSWWTSLNVIVIILPTSLRNILNALRNEARNLYYTLQCVALQVGIHAYTPTRLHTSMPTHLHTSEPLRCKRVLGSAEEARGTDSHVRCKGLREP